MRKVRRLFSVLLALAMLAGMVTLPAEAAGSYELVISSIQKVENGVYDASSASVTSANKGNVLVVTASFKNNTSSAVSIGSFGLEINYDTTYLTPYRESDLFNGEGYEQGSALTGWTVIPNIDAKNNFVFFTGFSLSSGASVSANGELPLVRLAFQVKDSAPDGTAAFTFPAGDSNAAAADDATNTPFTLGEFETYNLTIGEGGSGGGGGSDDPPPVVSNYALDIQTIQKVENGVYNASSALISSAKKGDIVVLTAAFKNNTDSAVSVGSFGLQVDYDTTRLTPYKERDLFNGEGYEQGAALTGWTVIPNVDANNDFVFFTGFALSSGASVPANGELPLVRLAFQVKDTAPDGAATFTLPANDSNAAAADDATNTPFTLGAFASSSIYIGDLAIDSVTVTPATAEVTVPDSGADAVTASFTAEAKDQSGNVITGQAFTWTWDGDGKFDGVTFTPATATVAVAPGAAVTKDETVTVTAASGGKSGTATLTIHPNGGSSPGSLTATVTDPNNNNQPVSAVTKSAETQTFRASVNAPDGAAVEWTATTADGTPVTLNNDGIGVDANGNVTITADAKAGTYYIVANANGQTASAPLTVAEGGDAPSVTLDHVTLSQTSVTLDGSAGTQSTAAAFDADNNSVTGVTWSVSPAGQGVTIEASGLITIIAAAAPGEYEITATYGGDSNNSAKATLTVRRDASADAVLDHVTLTPASVKADGSADAPAATSAAAAFDADNNSVTGVTWSIEPSDKGVTISASGEINVPATTAPGEFTVTAAHNGVSKSATLTVTAEDESMSVRGDRASIEIPGINAASDTISATFTAIDIETGNRIVSGLKWSIAEKDTGAAVPGVTINEDTGTVTVDKTARFQITDTPDASGLTGKTMIVTATRESDGKSATAPIIVRRADAALAIVTLSLDGQSVSTGGETLSVVSDGSAAKSVSAVAQDQYGENVEGEILWELASGGNGLNLSGSGVSFSGGNGVSQTGGYQAYVAIGTTAKHGTYIVKATQGAITCEARMTISRGDEIVSDLTLSEGQNEIEIPGKDGADNRSNAFKALVKNQYREDMPDAEVQWAITDASGAEVPGLTIENGVVIVAYAAKEAVTDTAGRYFTVSAAAGELQPRTQRILVKRAAPYLNSITLNQQDASQSVTVSIDGGEDVAVLGEAWDQYESPIAAQTWTVSPLGFGSGVTAHSDTGVISVSKDATPGNYNVSASLNGRTVGPNLMIVSRGAPVPTRVLISGGQASVTIPGDGQSPAPAAQAYAAIVKDQFNSDMADQNVAWSITDESGALVSGISIENGVVIVANEAKSFIPAGTWKSMKVRAACGSIVSDPADIYVRRADSILSQVRIESPLVENDITVIEYDGAGEQTVAATALDQYGETFNGASWELTSYNASGVNVNPSSGAIAINSSAADGVVHTLTAKFGSQSPSAAFRIKKVASSGVTLTSVTVTPTSVGIPSGAQAAALNGDGQEIRYGIAWSVHPENQGVSVGGDGRVYVSSEAKPDNYVILAQPDGVSVLGTPKSATLTVQAAPPPTVTFSRVELLLNTLTVNGTSAASTQAIAYDANNSPILSDIKWNITPTDGEVTIDSGSGVITASRSAIAGVYTVTGTIKDGGTKDGVSHTAELTVRREAQTTLANVLLSQATVAVDGTNAAASSARAVDASNQTLASGVTWRVSPENQGVSINANGEISIAAATETGDYKIIAAYGGASKEAVLRVNKSDAPPAPVTLVSVTLSEKSVAVDGATAQSATAAANGSDGQPITTGVTWRVSPENQGVEISASGAISIAATAETGDYKIAATYGGERKDETLHVTNNAPVVPPAQGYAVTVTPAAVTVNGAAARTAQASATTSDNASVTGGIVWSVAPAGNGVSIDPSSGKISVAATAAGLTYTVTGARGAESHSATLTVTNGAPPTLSSVSLNPAAIALNGQAAASAATAISSNDAPLTSGVTWSVSPDGQGVSINANGEIAIAATALEETYTVSATYQTTTRSAALTVTGGADVKYAETNVDTAAAEIANTPLSALSYSATGVKSVADQAKLQRAALSVPQVKQAVETPAAGTETKVRVTIEIKPKSYNPFVVSVTPMCEVIQKSGDTETTLSKEPLSELDEPVTVSLNVPADCDAAFAKHTHDGVDYYEPISYGGAPENPVASWTQQYFSDVTLTKEAATITFNPNGVTTTGVPVSGAAVTPTTKTVTLGGKLDSLPTPVAPVVAGYVFTFDNWYLGNELADLNTVFTKAETLTAHWTSLYTGGSGGGGGGGGGGGSGSSSGGSSSSSGGSSSKVEYNITLSSGAGGNLSASAKKAVYGTTITVVPTPNAGYELDTLTIKTRAGKDVDFSTSAGTYSFEMPRSSVTVTATFERSASPSADNGNTTGNNSGNNNSGNNANTTPTPPYSSVSFVDMTPDNFFYTAVQWAVERGITNGTTATTFSPNQACTRAQMVMFLWRSQGMPMPSANYSPFTDVDPGANYYTAMLWAVERGITNGTTATTFEPYAACTRAQMVMFLHRVAGRPTPAQTSCPFTDITVGENYYVPMLWALERGITNGTTATTFSPYQACTRAQMVMFLYRYLGGN